MDEPGEPAFVLGVGVSTIWVGFFPPLAVRLCPLIHYLCVFRRIGGRVSFRKKSSMPTTESHR